MLRSKIRKHKKIELSWVILLVILFFGLALPYLKYYFKLPDYFDFIYVLYFVYIVIASSDTREPVIGALILLATCPLLLIKHLDKFAELVAIGAFYLLVVGVFAQLVEFIREKKQVRKYAKK